MKTESSTKTVTWALVLVATLAARDALAQAPNEDEAVKLYGEGSELLVKGEAAAALDKLARSAELLPSPNTDLLIGHALRLASRKVEAIETYEKVVADAGEKVRAGEDRYKAALADAGRWVAVLRSELGELEVVVRGAKAGATIRVAGAAVRPEREGDALRVRAWREPGQVRVEVDDEGKAAGSETVTLAAGKKRQLRFELGAPTAEGPRDGGDGGVPATSLVAAGVGVAGFATFAVFGALSLGNKEDLKDCNRALGTSGCSKTEVEGYASDGKRNQTLANVGVVVGVVGMAAATAFFVFTPRGAPASAASASTSRRARSGSWSVGVGPMGGSVRGTF